jgi:xanthine dehydrogenase iron-sulfur cluster and FAD-binding subunit A
MEAAAGKGIMVDRLVFALNGRLYEVASRDVDPSMPLLEFIRTRTPFKGTKLGCGEGNWCIRACLVL